MRYKPKSIAALQLALGGLPDRMRVEVDSGIKITAKTVGELRKVTAWPENLAITTPQERYPESAVRVSRLRSRLVRRRSRSAHPVLVDAGAVGVNYSDARDCEGEAIMHKSGVIEYKHEDYECEGFAVWDDAGAKRPGDGVSPFTCPLTGRRTGAGAG